MAMTTKAAKPAKKAAAAAAPKAAPRAAAKTKAAVAPAKTKPAKGSLARKPVVPRTAAASKPAGLPARQPVSAEQRRHYIEVAAYFIAERRGFSATSELENWTQAEAEIDRLLSEGKLNV